jgi:hypothetical protein
MPIYEYQGQQYDIATDDPTVAKAKILKHLGAPAPAAPAAPAGQTTPAQSLAPTQGAEYDFGSPMGTGAEEIMAGAGPRKTETRGFDPSAMPEQFKSGVAGMQQGWYTGAAKNVSTNLNVMDRIDKGEQVPDAQDPVGYQYMNPEQRAQVRAQFGKTLTTDVAKALAYNAEQKTYVKNPNADAMIQAANKKDWGKAWEAFSDDPAGVIQQLSVQSAPNALPSLAGGAAGVLLRGGVPALMAGLGTGSFPVEYMSSLVDSLQESGVDMKDAAAVEAKLRDPKFLEDIGKKAVTRGVVIAATDAAAGKLLMPLRPGQLGKNITRGGANIAAEVGTEMGGEAGAQVASGETIKFGDIIAEGLGAGPQAVATTALKTIEETAKETPAAEVPGKEKAAPSKEPTIQDLASGKLPKTVQEDEADEREAIAQQLIGENIPKDSAYTIAEKRVLENRKERIKDLIAEPSDDPVHQRAKEYIDGGMDPIEAVNTARQNIAQETEADALAQAEAGGTPSVAEPIPEPSGAGAQVVGQPSAMPAPAGIGAPQPTGMVPTPTNVGQPIAGEGIQPSPVAEQVQALEAERDKLLLKNGKRPAAKSPAGKQFDAIQTQIAELQTQAQVSVAAPQVPTVQAPEVPAIQAQAPAPQMPGVPEVPTQPSPVADQIKTLEIERDKLLLKDGKRPAFKSPAGKKFDAIQAQIAELQTQAQAPIAPPQMPAVQAPEMPGIQAQAPIAPPQVPAVQAPEMPGIQAQAPITQAPIEPVQPTTETAAPAGETAVQAAPAETPEVSAAPAASEGLTPESTATTEVVTEEQKPAGKRGRKPLALTEEERAAKEGQTRDTNAANARERRAIERADAQLTEANEPINPEEYENDEQVATAQHEKRARKIQAIRTLLDMAKKHGSSALGNRAKAVLADRERIPQREYEDIRRGWQATQASRAARTSGALAKVNPGVKGTMTAGQALTQVSKTGSVFEKKLAGLIRKLLVGVEVVVVERSDPLPAALQGDTGWDRARAVYVPPADGGGKRVVYLRGASFGEHNGVNNVTILHELLHAALNRKVWAGLRAGYDSKDAPLTKFVAELEDLMGFAGEIYRRMEAAGRVPADLQELVEATLVVDPDTNRPVYEIFELPHEFLSYGMTESAMQNFMRALPSQRGNVFSRFARAIMDYLGLKDKDASAFTDFLSVTEDIATAKMPVGYGEEAERAYQKKKPPAATVIPANEDEYGNAIRSAKELKKDSLIAQEKTRLSREGTELKGAEDLFKARNADDVLNILKELVAVNWKNMSHKAVDALVRMPTMTFLANWSGVQSIKDADMHMQAMTGMANALTASSYKIRAALARELNPFFRSAKDYRNKFENLIYETTIARYDPSDPKNKVRDKRLDQLYRSVGPKGQKLYAMLRDYYRNLADLYSDLLDRQVEGLQGLSVEAKDNLMRTLRATFETGARIKPFFPLVRYGDYWFRVEKGENRGFYMFETPGERDQFARQVASEMKEDMEDSRFFETGDTVRSMRLGSQSNSQMLTQAFDAIDKQDFGEGGTEAKEALKDAIYQIYLNTMPEQSFRKMFIHRKDRTGFSTDVLRNVAATASRMSMQLARLKYAPLLRNSVSAAHDAVRGRSNLSPFAMEAERRVNLALAGNSETGIGDAIAGIANKASYFWYLSSAASALIQPASVYISALPVIGANHNDMTGAAKELGKMITLLNQYTVFQNNPDGTTSMVAPSLANNKSLPKNEQDAVREMFQRGVTQTTYTSLVWGYKSLPTREASSLLGKTKELGAEAANLAVGALMHNTERLTREATFLASYRLGFRQFQTQGMSQSDAHEAAINQAVSDVNEALANYDVSNRPRWMQQGVGKVAFQFKMFPLHTALLLTTNFLKMMPILNKEGKAVAAKKFFGIYLTAGSIAGLAGIPAFSPILGILAYALKQLKDDGDEPEEFKDMDPETWFRTVFLPEMLGDVSIGDVPVADILERGPLNAMTGLAISQRIGLNDLFGRDTKEGKTNREGTVNWVIEHAGPSVSLGLSVADAYDSYQQGDFEKSVDKIAPAAIRNWILADRMTEAGIKDSKGKVLIPADKAGGYALAQRIGFRPDVLTTMGETNFKLTAAEQKILNERNLLLTRLKVQARKDSDEGRAEIGRIFREEIAKFNVRHPEQKIEGEDAGKAILADLEARATTRAGHKIDEKNARLVNKTLTYLEERIERERKRAGAE